MEPIHYLNVFRRRWWVIVGAVVVSTAAAVITTALISTRTTLPPPERFTATSVLWNPSGPTADSGSPISNPAAVAQLATQPQVEAIAAKRLDEDSAQLSGAVTSFVDATTGFIYLRATSSDPRHAEDVANAMSRAVITYLGKIRTIQLDQRERLLQRQIDKALELHLGTAVVAQLQQQRTQISLGRTMPVSFAVFSRPLAVPDEVPIAGRTWSRTTLILLAALLGLVLGICLVLVLERFDTTIRSREAAEDGFGRPVLAEVPSMSRRRRREVVTVSDPLSRAADSFRLLSVGVAHAATVDGPRGLHVERTALVDGRNDSGGSASTRSPSPKTILVTSAESRDGKTTVAANLAAAYAEGGKRVLVLSCDLRRPAIHKMFNVADRPGLTELLGSLDGELDTSAKIDLSPYVEMPSKGLAVMPSGMPSRYPGQVLGSAKMHKLVDRTKTVADVVVLDSAPLLVASDAAALATEVDAVVLVARAGKTRAEVGGRTTTLLEQLGATVVGVVLNDSTDPFLHRSKRHYRPTWGMRRASRPSPSEEQS